METQLALVRKRYTPWAASSLQELFRRHCVEYQNTKGHTIDGWAHHQDVQAQRRHVPTLHCSLFVSRCQCCSKHVAGHSSRLRLKAFHLLLERKNGLESKAFIIELSPDFLWLRIHNVQCCAISFAMCRP